MIVITTLALRFFCSTDNTTKPDAKAQIMFLHRNGSMGLVSLTRFPASQRSSFHLSIQISPEESCNAHLASLKKSTRTNTDRPGFSKLEPLLVCSGRSNDTHLVDATGAEVPIEYVELRCQ